MKFTSLEPLNQKFNEELKNLGLKNITDIYEKNKEINNYLKNLEFESDTRIFDETNETCSQILIKENKDKSRYAVVLISSTDEPTYDRIFIVE